MAIQGIKQPEVIVIDDTLRLRKFAGDFSFALEWYQDEDTNYLVDGKYGTYNMDQLSRMYQYLEDRGELYFIEVLEHDGYRPVGDVAFWQEDMPIVVGDPRYRGKGIGRRVILALIARARELGYGHISVREIYDWNEASRRCFEGVGFRAYEKTEKGSRYKLDLLAERCL